MAFFKTELIDITCDMCGKPIDAAIAFPPQYAIVTSKPTKIYVNEEDKGALVIEKPDVLCRDCAFAMFFPADGKFKTPNGKTATVQIVERGIENVQQQSNKEYYKYVTIKRGE